MSQRPSPKGSRGSGDRRKADDPIHAEHQRLREAQETLLRQQEKARRVIENAPRRIEQLKKRQREGIKIDLKTGNTGQRTFGLPRDKFSSMSPSSSRPRIRKSDRNIAKLQFIILCMILFAIVLLLWRVVPQQ